MELTLENLLDELKNKKVRLSHQRIKVLEYLVSYKYHPTVDQIYNGLKKDVPTLSKTTIYNTLDSFVDAGMLRVITIEDNETRYDIDTGDHGHFKCEICKEIYDFKFDISSITSDDLSDFKVTDKNVYYKGVCPKCLLI